MSIERLFLNRAASVSEARRYVVGSLDGVAQPIADTIAVLVSELATNAIRHSASDFTVTIERSAAFVRVSVRDNGPGNPTVRAPGPTEPSGRGMQIIQSLAADWGVLPAHDGQGKTVWFTVAVPAGTNESAPRSHEAARTSERSDHEASDVSLSETSGGPIAGTGRAPGLRPSGLLDRLRRARGELLDVRRGRLFGRARDGLRFSH